jgi:hypothetical protein
MKVAEWEDKLTGSYLKLTPWMHLRVVQYRDKYEAALEQIRAGGFRGEYFEYGGISASSLEEAKNSAVLWAKEYLRALQEKLEVER